MLDQAERLRRLARESSDEPRKKAKIITITSGKGGVGKSNIVVNLAIQLQRMGNKVLVFDADIGMGNDDVLMGIYPRYNIFNVISNNMDILDVLCEGPEGIKLLSGGSGINKIEDLNEREREIFLEKLESLDDFDYILMDTGAGINRSVLAFITCCDQLIVITTPEPTSLTDAYSLLKAVNHFKIKDKASVIVNKTYSKEEGTDTYYKFNSAVNRFLSIELDYLGQIYDDKKLVEAVRSQVPFSVQFPNSDAARCIKQISSTLGGGNESSDGIGARGLFKKIFNIFS